MGEIDRSVGICIHKLDMGMRRIIDTNMKAAGYDEVTLMHGWILKYLYDNRNSDVYQRDIEKNFGICRSTVTTIIQLMEKRDLIHRESVEQDARLKKVVLSEKGYQHHDLVTENINRMHMVALEGISQEEKEIFLKIAGKMAENIKKCRDDAGTHSSVTIIDLKEE